MQKKFKDLLLKRINPYIVIGIESYALLLGELRRNLMLRTFKEHEADQIILTMINLFKRGK